MKTLALLLAIIFWAGCGGTDELDCATAVHSYYQAGCYQTFGDGSYLPQKTAEEYCLSLEYNSYERNGHCLPEMDRYLACLSRGKCDCEMAEGRLKLCFGK